MVTGAVKSWRVVNIFGSAGADHENIAYATVTVTSANGLAWVYASVVDNISGDGTTIPVLVIEQ